MRLVTKTGFASKYEVCERAMENWLARMVAQGSIKKQERGQYVAA